MKKRGYDQEKLWGIVEKLANEILLPAKCRDHALTGNYVGCRECHIEPDWLLVYETHKDELILLLVRTGSHSDLF